MESEGPYFHRCGTPGEKSNCKACAYEEGRKSMEKDLHDVELSLKHLVDRHESLVDDFKELLELANQAGNFNQDMMQWKIKFEDWKKSRGIE